MNEPTKESLAKIDDVWDACSDAAKSFYNRWGIWIPLEGRQAFLAQLAKLEAQP